jgi:Ca2+-transporting ATPase
MGTGSQTTKDCSDLIILDNKLVSIFNAIMWGRTIYENVKKFM